MAAEFMSVLFFSNHCSPSIECGKSKHPDVENEDVIWRQSILKNYIVIIPLVFSG